MYVCVCVIVMRLSVEISLSNVGLTRNYMQEREKNKTILDLLCILEKFV